MNTNPAFALLAAALCGTALTAAPVELTGDLWTHDPSTIVECGDAYWLFHTGWGCRAQTSKDLVHWREGPRVFAKLPGWVQTIAPGCRGDAWAPDIIRLNGRYHLYYSVSAWGRNVSGIGLATNPTLDPADPAFRWTDQGVVVQSVKTNDFNAIDPAVFHDADGRLWLVFGSHWSGIKLVPLDPGTGKRLDPAAPPISLAWHEAIEAAFLCQRGPHYYLFVNWGQCCRGVNSTYEIRVGRSAKITGPYLDRDGSDMLRGGGSPFLGTTGTFIGPGHAAILEENGAEWFTCHFYDGLDRGRPKISLRRLRWIDGWPALEKADTGSGRLPAARPATPAHKG